jgi:5-methylcytosine-specific restriction enzyme subunit McrC
LKKGWLPARLNLPSAQKALRGIRAVAEIPIQNVYYLLCYAWGQMQEGSLAEAGATGHTELADLFADVLLAGTRRVLRQGLDRGYVARSEDTARLRGRINFSASAKRALLPQAKAHCTFDELSRNVLHNQILRSTLRRLRQVERLDEDLRSGLRGLERRFRGVDLIPLSGRAFGQLQLHAGNSFYRFLMNVCRLVHQNTIATESGARRFQNFRRDEAQMWRLFENFVYNFYEHEQSTYRVSSPRIQWDRPAGAEKPARLPTMNTDIVLRSSERAIIIDTKFYRDTLGAHHEKQSYHSGNLYQLFSYLKNAAAQWRRTGRLEGILLYPTVATALDDSFVLGGHRVRVATLDLAGSWQSIRDRLLLLAGL